MATIVTVHDLAPLRDRSLLTPGQLARFRGGLDNLHRADCLIADSKATAEDVAEFLGIDAARVHVLLLGVNTAWFARRRQGHLPGLKLPPGARRILSVGSCVVRKNLKILPDVLRAVRARVGDIVMVRVGERLPGDLAAQIESVVGAGRLIELGKIGAEALAEAYQGSDVLVFPSYLEGFGLPVAEAMAAGCPVVASNATSLPEVGGDAALYFDPESPDEAAGQIIRILDDPTLRATLIERGTARAEALSWKNHASHLMRIYESVEASRS